jgi:hypothetical protein
VASTIFPSKTPSSVEFRLHTHKLSIYAVARERCWRDVDLGARYHERSVDSAGTWKIMPHANIPITTHTSSVGNEIDHS